MDELRERHLLRFEDLATKWDKRAGGRTWTPPEPEISDAERKCAEELRELIRKVEHQVLAQPVPAEGAQADARNLRKEAEKCLACLYLAVEPRIADDVALHVRAAFNAYEAIAAAPPATAAPAEPPK
jgi:hypothetical protein